jgi:excisionase family DNA binding protein
MTAAMLTAQQVQDLLDVDASTVYRMAGDGRLPAVRIGRQWRFPADAIERLLVPRDPGTPTTAATAGGPPGLPVSPTVATEVLDTVAHALGVSMVVTDLGGRALTPIVNPAPAIAARQDDPDFLARCSAEWRGLADEPHLAPRFRPSEQGFLCAHALVRHGPTLVAMVLAGGIAPAGDRPDLFHLDAAARRRVLDALPRTAALLSRLAAIAPAG